jgi:serine/threonine protein kinase/tetratricopeptide (TPR) repeat protein
MHVSEDIMLALILVESRTASRTNVKQLWAKRSALGLKRGGHPPPLGQLLTQEKILSPRQFLTLKEIVSRCRCQCLGCHRPFSVLPAKRAGRRYCLRCGTYTPTPMLDLSRFDTSNSDRSKRQTGNRRVPAQGRVDEFDRPIPDFIGPYKIVDYIATGGMGIIYRAADPDGGIDMALKVLRKDSTGDLIERFKREGEAEARLKHPSIVEVYDLGEDDGMRYFTMELVDGEPFDEYLKKDQPYKKVLPLLAQIAHGLEYAHDNGLIHRDLKPQNILITRDERAKLTDFGLARDLGLSSLSNDGDIIGTPLYMAPEQMSSRIGKIDRRTDVFALGVILFQILTETLPFPAQSLVELQQKLMNEAPPAPRSLNAAAPAELEGICLKALEKQPRNRYQTAQDFAVDLEKWLRGESLPIFTPSQSQAIKTDGLRPQDLTRIPAMLIIGLVVAVLAVLIIGLIALAFKSQDDPGIELRAKQFVSVQVESEQRIKRTLFEIEGKLAFARKNQTLRPQPSIEALQVTLPLFADLERVLSKQEGDVRKNSDEAAWLNAELRIELASLLARKKTNKRLAQATKVLSPLLKNLSFSLRGQLLFANILLQQGNPKRALKIFQEVYESRGSSDSTEKRKNNSAIASRAEMLQALFGRGRATLQLSRPGFALKDFELLREMAQESGALPNLSVQSIQFQLAKARLGLGQVQKTLKILEQLCDEDGGDNWPERLEALELLARLKLDGEKLLEAGHYIEKVGYSAENASLFQRLSGLCALKKGDYNKALERFNKILRNDPKPLAEDFVCRAEAKLRGTAHDPDPKYVVEAIRDYGNALTRAPGEAAIYLGRARLHYLNGDARKVRQDLRSFDQFRTKGGSVALRHERDLLEMHLLRASAAWDVAMKFAEQKLAEARKTGGEESYLSHNMQIEFVELKLMAPLNGEELLNFVLFSGRRKSARHWRVKAKLKILSQENREAKDHLKKALGLHPQDEISLGLLNKLLETTNQPKYEGAISLPVSIPRLSGPFAEHWDPVLEALYFRKMARKLKDSKDKSRAREFENWSSRLLGPKDQALLSRQ